MSSDERLQELLDVWAEAAESGTAPSPGDLCHDCPELQPELERRVGVLQRFACLQVPDKWDAEGHPPGRAPRGVWPEPRAPGSGPVPEMIGGYRIIRLLGEGGMGAVYEADDSLAQRRIALKVTRPEFAARLDFRERFLREARTAAGLQHDHIGPIYEVGEDHGTLFIAMPLLQGETLETRLKRQERLPWREAAQIAREVAEGLAAAHARGLIHRDVKPGNIWLEVLASGGRKPPVGTDQ